MKKLKALLLIIVMVVLTMGYTINDDWYLFESNGFKIEFPQKPTSEPQVINSDIGELKMNIFTYDASESKEDENLVYLVSSTEFPDSIINSEKTEILPNLFRNSIDGAVTNVSGKLLSEKIIEIDGFPGREVKIDYKDGNFKINIHIYMVKNKMYMLETITETKKDNNKSIARFMDSFKLTT